MKRRPGGGRRLRLWYLLLLEQLHRVDQRLRHARDQRNADKRPGGDDLPGLGSGLLVLHVHSPYARAGAAAAGDAESRSTGSATMWKRLLTALTNRLQM